MIFSSLNTMNPHSNKVKKKKEKKLKHYRLKFWMKSLENQDFNSWEVHEITIMELHRILLINFCCIWSKLQRKVVITLLKKKIKAPIKKNKGLHKFLLWLGSSLLTKEGLESHLIQIPNGWNRILPLLKIWLYNHPVTTKLHFKKNVIIVIMQN